MTDIMKKMDDVLASFIGLDRMWDNLGFQCSYPPYDVIKKDQNTYELHMALAGFKREDLDITLSDNVLSIKGSKKKDVDKLEYIHKGIAQRAFEFRIGVSEWAEVQKASMKDGLLIIELKIEQKQDSIRKIDIVD